MAQKSQQCSGYTSSESLAFREVYQDLVTATMYDTQSLAVALYSKGMISSSVRDECSLQTSTPETKAIMLLCAVEAEVKVNPNQFMTFVSTLRELEEPSRSFADRLMQAKENQVTSIAPLPRKENGQSPIENGQSPIARNGVNGHSDMYSKVKAEPPLAKHFQCLDVEEDELIVQTRDIRGKFLVIFTRVRRCLENKGVTVRDFIGFLKQVPGYARKSLLEVKISKLCEAPDLIAVFESVGECCSWFNHSLLGLIIDAYCEDNKTIKKAHQDYCAHLRKYCRHRVKKFPFKNGFGNGGKKDEIMVMKIDRKWEEIQIEQLEEVVFDIACILKVSRHTLHLCTVENGCVQLTLLVPSNIPEEVFPLTTEQEAAMRDMGVIDLQCGSYHFSCQKKLSYTLPAPTYKDWLRGWREWAHTRKRGMTAQFVIDKLEDNKQAHWLDITIGKFELTQWHTIADEWFMKAPGNSDQVDAPCMLRKGLPRAFPGLEEVKSESIKEGTQYRSRVFQAAPQLVQDVILHMGGFTKPQPHTNYPTAAPQTHHGLPSGETDKNTTSKESLNPPEHILLSPPQKIKITVSNYEMLQKIKTISKERLVLPSHKQLKLSKEEQFCPRLTIQDAETCQPFNCTILLPDEPSPPTPNFLCRLSVTVEPHPMRPLHHMQRNGALMHNTSFVELQFCFIRGYTDYFITFSVASITDSENVQHIGYSCEKCECVVQAVDQHTDSILSMPHVFTQYHVPCRKALYRKFDESFNHLIYSGGHTARVDRLVSTFTSNQNLSLDIKVEALCFQALERLLRYLPEESLFILDQALALADQPFCINSQLLKGRILFSCASAHRMLHHYGDALQHIQQAKCMYFSAAPSRDTSNVFYGEAILREFLSEHTKDRSRHEHLYFMAIDHAGFGSQLEDDHDLCVMQISKAVYHLKSVYISKLKPPISEEDIHRLQPTLDDLSKAEESLRVAETDIDEMSAFNKGTYNCAMSDLYLWRRDYQKAIQSARLAKQQYALVQLNNLVSYVEARLSLLTTLDKQQTDA